MKKKIIKISSITLAVAIMLCGALSARALPPDDPTSDAYLTLYGEGSGVYVDGNKIAELQYNTDEINIIKYFAIDGSYYRIANGFTMELTTPFVFELTYASDKYDNASVEYTVQFDDGGYTFPTTITYDETAHKYVITATVDNYNPMSQSGGVTYNAVIKLNLSKATEPEETTANILTTYYGAVVTVVPMIVAWYGDNTVYLATTAGLFAIAAIIAIIFGVRRNKKKGGDS